MKINEPCQEKKTYLGISEKTKGQIFCPFKCSNKATALDAEEEIRCVFDI